MNIDHPSQKHIPVLKALWREAFGDSEEFINSFFDTAYRTDKCFAVTEGDNVISALYILDCSFEGRKLAYIYAVATSKAYRGRGICKRLMQYTHESLEILGYEGAVLVPGEKSLFDFYERLGYITRGYKRKTECVSSGKIVNIKRIDGEEYGRIRRKYLPFSGVIQENDSLCFLARQAELYAGNDFLLAARREGESLLGIELLGNTHSASDIVCTLGCTDGTFMTVGRDISFAMYLSFGNRNLYPEYFGLAFD